MAGEQDLRVFNLLIVTVSFLSLVTPGFSMTWPLPPKNYTARPPADPKCPKEATPFCWNGVRGDFMPNMSESDQLFVYVMSAPDSNDISLKEKVAATSYVSKRYALGFHHVQSGLNMTLQWYEIHQPYNCTFALEQNDNVPLWCNQGAACLAMGVNKDIWTKHGSVNKVADINGKIFNEFAAWVEKDNKTYPFVQSWTVINHNNHDQTYFPPVDRASWLIRALDALKESGANFNNSQPLSVEYPLLVLYSQEPEPLKNNSGTWKNLAFFFGSYKRFHNLESVVHELTKNPLWYIIHDRFYYFFNEQYWGFNLQIPFAKVINQKLQLPTGL